MTNTINFCGTECEVLKRYEISEEYANKHGLIYRNRITFVTPNGDVIDCADTEYKEDK